MTTTTFTDRVASVFQSHPGQWISCYELMTVGGAMAWRTRTSECRKRGMTIENRLRKRPDGSTISEYRYVPAVPAQLEMGL